jgi:hypothetical protein
LKPPIPLLWLPRIHQQFALYLTPKNDIFQGVSLNLLISIKVIVCSKDSILYQNVFFSTS